MAVVLDEYRQLAPLRQARRHLASVTAQLQQIGYVASSDVPAPAGSRADVQAWMARWTPPAGRQLILYWIGHGQQLGTSACVLLTADTDTADPDVTTTIPVGTLGAVLARCDVDEIVVIVDACYSGGGYREVQDAFVQHIRSRSRPEGRPRPALAVITSADYGQVAQENVFTPALARVLRDGPPAGFWGDQQRDITPTELTAAVRRAIADQEITQDPQITVDGTSPHGSGEIRILNPRYRPGVADRDGEHLLWSAVAQPDLTDHFLAKFRSLDVPAQEGLFFTGRAAPLRDLAGWLRDGTGMVVVTGAPGSGKSALLGRTVALTDPRLRAALLAEDPGIDPTTLPRENAIAAGVYAKNKTVVDCVNEFASTLGLATPAAGWQHAQQFIDAVGRSGRSVTLLLDGLDEARRDEVDGIARDLLGGLADQPRIRVVVGTRRTVAGREDLLPGVTDEVGPGLPAHAAVRVIDLDRYPAEHDVAEYTERRLTTLPGSPYRNDDPSARHAVAALAALVAARSGGNFLLARLVSRALATRPERLRPGDPELEHLVATDVTAAFDAELRRYHRHRTRVADLLRALAWAEGNGLPRRDVWLAVANALRDAEQPYTDADVAWTLERCGAYLTQSGEHELTVYRLYHQSFADYFRERGAGRAAAIHARICAALSATVERGPSGRPRWKRSGPYVRTYLPVHAARAGSLAELTADSRFLLFADPARLTSVLDAVDHTRRPLVRLYWRAADRIVGAGTAERASILQDVALVDEPAALPLLHMDAEAGWTPRWSLGVRASFHRRLDGPTGSALCVAVAVLDGRPVLAAGTSDGRVRLWDPLAARQTAEAHTGGDGVRLVALGSQVGRHVLVTCGADLRTWDAVSGRSHAVITTDGPVRAVALSDGADEFLAAQAGTAVRLWDSGTGAARGAIAGDTADVRCLAFGVLAGRRVLAGGDVHGRIRLWDPAGGVQLAGLSTGGQGVRTVAFGVVDDATVVAAGLTDGGVLLWYPATGRHQRFSGHSGTVLALAFGELSGKPVLATAGDDRTVRIRSLRTGETVAKLVGHHSRVLALIFSVVHGRRTLSTASDDGTVRLWDGFVRPGAEPSWAGGRVQALAFHTVSGQGLLASASSEDVIRLWDAMSGAPAGQVPVAPTTVHSLAFGDLDGRRVLAVGGHDGSVSLVDVVARRRMRTLRRSVVRRRAHGTGVWALAFGAVADRVMLASGGDDGTVCLWDPRRGGLVATLTSHAGWIWTLAFGGPTDRPVLASGGDDGTVHLWDVPDGRLRTSLTGHAGSVRAVALGVVDGVPMLASGGYDGEVRLWNIATAVCLAVLSGHQGSVLDLAFADGPGGPVLMSASDEPRIHVWRLPDGELIRTATGQTGRVLSMAFDRNGGTGMLATGSEQQIVVRQIHT